MISWVILRVWFYVHFFLTTWVVCFFDFYVVVMDYYVVVAYGHIVAVVEQGHIVVVVVVVEQGHIVGQNAVVASNKYS